MDYAALATLIQTHPQWPSVTDADLVTWVNEEAISRDKPTVPSGTIFAAILTNLSEWEAMSEASRAIVKDVLYIHSGEGVPTAVGSPARNLLVAKLGTQTKLALAAEIAEQITRAVNAGIPGTVNEGHIVEARGRI